MVPLSNHCPRPRPPLFASRSPFSFNSGIVSIRTMASSEVDNGHTAEGVNTHQLRLLYLPMDEIEPFERYRPGGYHPVRIGDRFCSRYQVVHKLGFGTSSTIWLARDEKMSTYVAIKIAIAEIEFSRESDILRLLEQPDSHPGRTMIPPLLDEFDIHGPDGTHRCFVTDAARMSIAEACAASSHRLFQLPVARVIVAQLVRAVAFLHYRGVVHSGKRCE